MKSIRIIAAVLLAVMLLPVLAACIPIAPRPEQPKHECKHVCPTCGKCTDETCTDKVCADKCTCPKETTDEQVHAVAQNSRRYGHYRHIFDKRHSSVW